MVGFYSVLGLFLLHFSIFVRSYAALKRGNQLDSLRLKGQIIPFEASGMSCSRLSPWMTRIFIAIVALCAAVYLISAYPGTENPFWLGIVLQFFIYGSAALCYASWRNEPHDE